MIVKMSKIAMLGMDDQRKQVIESLMDIGAVEISVIDADECEDLADHPSVQSDISVIDTNIADTRTALASLDKYCPQKTGLFQSRKEVSKSELTDVLKNNGNIRDLVSEIREQEDHLIQLKNEENRINNLYSSLLSWNGYPLSLEITGTCKTFFLPGTIPSTVQLTQLVDELNNKAPYSEMEVIHSDKEQHYIFVVYHHEMEQDCLSCLKAFGFIKETFPGLTGTISENIENLRTRLKDISDEREKAIELINGLSKDRVSLEAFHDSLAIEHARTVAAGNVMETKRTFLIKGWIPEKIALKSKEWLESKYTVSIDITEPDEDEEFPVFLKNEGIAEAGEPVSNMYSLPNSREIDPNSVMTPFFVLFFGLMLSDGGYGIILALVAGLALWKFKLEGNTRKFMKLIFYCGISTIFWGLMFGGWFGIEALAKYGVWLNPIEEPELLLSWSLLFGVIHMYAGLALRAANLIRNRKYLDAIMDVGFVYIFYTGFILVLLPYVPKIDTVAAAPLVNAGIYVFIIGAVLMLLTQGRSRKNIFGRITGGLSSLYGVVGFMSDILSYSRLLALGLATGIIASIVNQMSMMFDFPLILKMLLAVVILLIGHTINLAINALGAYVHSCRLQYLEFFGKFFTGGGKPFRPLKANTKYFAVKPDAVD